jgi:hypothetical protein
MNGLRLASAGLAVLLAACGGNEQPQTGGPGPLGRRLVEGEAHVVLRGDIKTEFTVPLDPTAPNLFQPPDGGFALNWADETAQGMGVGGPLFLGSRMTGEKLSLSITAVQEGLPTVFGSFAGECGVTITTAGSEVIAGSFVCEELTEDGLTIEAEGEFTARG